MGGENALSINASISNHVEQAPRRASRRSGVSMRPRPSSALRREVASLNSCGED